MATALLSPLKESLQDVEILIYTPSFTSAEKLASIIGGKAIDQIQDLEIDELLLCHKPQQLSSVMQDWAGKINPSFVMSLMAGISIKKLKQHFPNAEFMRWMPNTPCQVGKGIVTTFSTDSTKASFWESALQNCAKVFPCETEELLDETTSILGSGPGVIFEFARLFSNELTRLGVSETDASELIKTLFFGSASLMKNESLSFEQLRNNVTSPGGVTQAILESLSGNLENNFTNAMKAGQNRTKELNN